MSKGLTLIVAAVFLVVLTCGAIFGALHGSKTRAQIFQSGGEEEPADYLISTASAVFQPPLSPHDAILGHTWHERQHFSRIPRMNANDYQIPRGLHFTFMEMEEPPGNRYVDYNYWDPNSGWGVAPPPSDRISVGVSRAGYPGLDVFRPLEGYFKSHSRPVVCYHTEEPVFPNPDPFYTVLSIEPDFPGQMAMGGGRYWYDIPDFIAPNCRGMYPACAIDSLNRIHVVMMAVCNDCKSRSHQLAPSPSGQTRSFGYVRCYEIPNDSIVCESPGFPERRIAKETYYTYQDWPVAVFAQSASMSASVVTSKVSNKVALFWVGPSEFGDVFYIESSNGGADWIAGGWIPPPVNVTNYDSDDYMRGFGDICGVYDLDDSLHFFWPACYYDPEPKYFDFEHVSIWHWSKATERVCPDGFYRANEVQQARWKARPGMYNQLMSKLKSGVGIIEGFNHNYLYLQWVQFNEDAGAANGYSQGDLYVTVSTDLGMTWNPPVNETNSTVPLGGAGNCASDHWSSMAERVDACVHVQWIYDRDAGDWLLGEGAATQNEVLYRCFPVDLIPIEEVPRITWSPKSFVKPKIQVPLNGQTTVYLTLGNMGTGTLNVTSISSPAQGTWLSINPTSVVIPAGGCPSKIALTITGGNQEEFLWTDLRIQSNDGVSNNDVYVTMHVVVSEVYVEPEFALLDNTNFRISKSNTGNLAHQDLTAGFYLYGDANEPNFLCDGSPAVAFTTPDVNPAVGRWVFNDHYFMPETELSVVNNTGLKTIISEAEFYPITPQLPFPWHHFWWWWTIKVKQCIFYSWEGQPHAQPPRDNKDEQYIALETIELFHNPPPPWWPVVEELDNLPATYLGMVLDIDCPADCDNENYPGFDVVRRLGFLQGSGGGANGKYRMGVAQRDPCYEFVVGDPPQTKLACWPDPNTLVQPDQPYAMHVLRNDDLIYPNAGYLDEELYGWMSTPGYSIQPPGDVTDYNIVATGAAIPARPWPETEVHEVAYALVVSDENGAAKQNALVDMIMCGNANRDGEVSLADVVYLVNYVVRPPSPEPWLFMSDCDGDGKVGLTDIVYLVNYMFRGGPPPQCADP